MSDESDLLEPSKFGADAGKYVSDDAKKTLVEITQLLERC